MTTTATTTPARQNQQIPPKPTITDLSILTIHPAITPDVTATGVIDAIPRLNEATIANIADHLETSEGAVAAIVRTLIDANVITQAGPTLDGHAAYVTVDDTPTNA